MDKSKVPRFLLAYGVYIDALYKKMETHWKFIACTGILCEFTQRCLKPSNQLVTTNQTSSHHNSTTSKKIKDLWHLAALTAVAPMSLKAENTLAEL